MNDYSAGTVVSTRIRLARNLDGYPFPARLKEERQAREIIRRVTTGFSHLINDFRLYNMDEVDPKTADDLKESHLISSALIHSACPAVALISEDKSVSIMINEEDHVREQCILKGLELERAYERMSEIDNNIAKTVKFAYDEQLGYLTACPTNLGTGLRASVMMFLPALTIHNAMPRLLKYLSRKGLTVRGMFGEGSQAEGYHYQISNEVTLGSSEETILALVKEVVEKIVELESVERSRLVSGPEAIALEDKCLRAYGVLTNCAMLSSEECLSLAGYVKLGACLGFLHATDVSAIDEFIEHMNAYRSDRTAEKQTTTERDRRRAEYAREWMMKNYSRC